MMRPKTSFLSALAGSMVIALALIAQQQPLTEAPAGFDTPTVVDNPGSQSVSNGLTEPPGDTFALDQQQFERRHDPKSGLGPVFNATSRAEYDQNGVTGPASQFTELRAGHKDANGNFVNPTIPINDGANTISGRSIVNDRSICANAQEHLLPSEDIRTLRAVLNTLGDGFVEGIDDDTLRDIAAKQPHQSDGLIHGEAIDIPVLEAPGQTRIGRFGWKDQQPTVLSFVADAYLNEMGVTNRLRPKDTTSVCKVTSDPEDVPDSLGLADIDRFAQFVRATKVPPRDAVLDATDGAQAGQRQFRAIGSNNFHDETIQSTHVGTAINGGTFVVPAALGDKIIHPFGDFLLHDVGTGDGIVQAGPPDNEHQTSTAPLLGVCNQQRF